jgi:PAS domain S-box-containing protein
MVLAMMENLPDYIYLKDKASRFLCVNLALAKRFGVSEPSQAVGKTDADFLSEERARNALADEQKILSTGQSLTEVEEKTVHPDGRESWELTTKLALRDGAGRIIGTCGISSDITGRKRTEEKLAQLNAQYKRVLLSIEEGILSLDLQGNHTYVNPAAAKMLGYEPQELIDQHNHSTWCHAKAQRQHLPKRMCRICAVYQDGMVQRSSTEVFWRKDGTSFPVEYASMPIFEQGKIVGAVVTFMEITARKQAENELRAHR